MSKISLVEVHNTTAYSRILLTHFLSTISQTVQLQCKVTFKYPYYYTILFLLTYILCKLMTCFHLVVIGDKDVGYEIC